MPIFIKTIISATLIATLAACGGGDGGGSSATNTNTESQIDYSNTAIYPIPESVVFRFHTTNDIFKLSNDSAWQITGTSNSGFSTGDRTSKVLIYSPTDNFPDPVEGVRSNQYLIGDNITPSFYIKHIPMQIFKKGTMGFSFNNVGDTISLSDGTAWQIMGSSNPSYSTGRLTSNVVIYTATNATPDPLSGIRTDYYLVGSGINPAFYVKKL